MQRQCFHCKEWIDVGAPHDCWTTTEAALTDDLPLDLREAWERLRETAADFGEQRIYASLHSIMFARKSCYAFVRPKRSYLEVCIFLGRPITAPQVRQIARPSKSKVAHMLRIRHRDEVEPPITDWLREAYDYNVAPRAVSGDAASATRTSSRTRAATGGHTAKKVKASRVRKKTKTF
jgi:hypothetical protein